MTLRIHYVLGGPRQSELEEQKRRGHQPLSEFNVFVARNDAQLVTTDEVVGGGATSLRRRVALARHVMRSRSAADMILASGEDIGFPLALLSMRRRRPPPIRMIVHGTLFGGAKFRIAAPLLRRARHVRYLCLSESLRAAMVDRHGFPADRCHAAGYGVDTEFFRPTGAGEPGLVVAAGCANRDYPTLIAAFEGLPGALRIAADSLWRPQARPIDRHAIPGPVELGPAESYLGLRALYGRAAFVVVPLHPARFASGYAVIAEAMAMGKAVITTRTEAPSDLVVEGETGLYTAPGDVAGLRARMQELLAHPDRASEMGARAAARMRARFTLERYCETIESLLDPVAVLHRAGAA